VASPEEGPPRGQRDSTVPKDARGLLPGSVDPQVRVPSSRWARWYEAFRRRHWLAPIPRLAAAADRIAKLPDRTWWLWAIGLGLVVRLILAPVSGEGDLEVYAESSVSMLYGQSPYTYLIVYPPGWILLLNVFGHLAAVFVPSDQLLASNPHLQLLNLYLGSTQPTEMFNPVYGLIEKSPLIVFDALTAWLLYRIVLDSGGSTRLARATFAAFFLNPLVIVVSSVHGAYDIMPTFFGLAGLYLLFQRAPLLGGLSLGLGIALKLFPVFLLPLGLAILVRTSPDARLRSALRPVLYFTAGLAAVLVLVFWPSGLLATYLTIVTTGPTVGQSFGGLGEYSILSIPGLEGARSWFFYHSYDVGLATGAIAGTLTLLATYLYVRDGVRPQLDARFGHALLATGFSMLLLFSILQSQYIVWIAPAFVLVGILDRRLRVTYWAVTGLVTIYYIFGLAGPLYFLEPLAVFTPYLSPDAVQGNVLWWLPLDPWIRLATSLPVFALLLFAAYRSWRQLALRPVGGTPA
jgi:hypothetical protein